MCRFLLLLLLLLFVLLTPFFFFAFFSLFGDSGSKLASTSIGFVLPFFFGGAAAAAAVFFFFTGFNAAIIASSSLLSSSSSKREVLRPASSSTSSVATRWCFFREGLEEPQEGKRAASGSTSGMDWPCSPYTSNLGRWVASSEHFLPPSSTIRVHTPISSPSRKIRNTSGKLVRTVNCIRRFARIAVSACYCALAHRSNVAPPELASCPSGLYP